MNSSEAPFKSFSTSNTFGFGALTESTSVITKLAFFLIVLFAFIILMRAGISVLSYLLKPTDSPHLIDGMVDATQMIVFPQDPNASGAKTIYRSVNAHDGLEFTWSVWIFIDNLQQNGGSYRHIFSKGNSDMGDNGMIQPNNAPGLYIAPNTNALVIVMNTYNVINEETLIPDIPLNKWINVIIRCQNTTLDVYINGIISRSIHLLGVPKQNYGDVYVAMNGGFDGNVSNLWYYNYALSTMEIQRIASKGPNTRMIGGNGMNDTFFNYLSMRWFFTGAGDAFNPAANATPLV